MDAFFSLFFCLFWRVLVLEFVFIGDLELGLVYGVILLPGNIAAFA